MNDEIQSILTSQISKNDRFFSNLQDQLGAGLTIIGNMITQGLNTAEKNTANDLIPKLSEAAQLILNVHHALSLKRKWEVNPLINDESRLAAQQTTIEEFLFGTQFVEKVNSTKTLKKAGDILKKTVKKVYKQNPGTSGAQDLNFKRPSYKFRKKSWRRNEQERSRPQKRKSAEKSSSRRQQGWARTQHNYT